MILAHKIELYLNNKQQTYMAKACGVARFSYNWALREWQTMHSAWKADNSLPKPNEGLLRKKLNAIKKDKFPWMLEVTKCAPQQAIINLGIAFKNFFKKQGKYPKPHRKGVHDSFSVDNGVIKIDGNKLFFPKLGWIKMREEIRLNGKILNATISRTADKWFVSFQIDVIGKKEENQVENQDTQTDSRQPIGIDLGITAFAAFSTGEKIEAPKPLKKLLTKLQRLQRSFSRKQKGSKNRAKARMKLAKLYLRIANIRKDFLHKLTTETAKGFSIIGIEDLNVRGMLKNKHLSRAISDMGWSEFKRQLEYKCKLYGSKLVIADKWFASSKTCSHCGYKLNKLPLSVREWECPQCHTWHDRDINAAVNLRNMAVSSTVTACGEEGSGLRDVLSSETSLCEAGI